MRAPLRFNSKIWGLCEKKRASRIESILLPFRKFTRGGKRILPPGQYWTLCGQCTLEDGSPASGSEIGQLTQLGFIKPEQFHGIDMDGKIIRNNRRAYPEAAWTQGEFLETISQQMVLPDFHPQVIHFDSMSMPQTLVPTVERLFHLMNHIKGRLMIVVNAIEQYGTFLKDRESDVEVLLTGLEQSEVFCGAWIERKWKMHPWCYEYDGTGVNSRTKMGSIAMYRAK